MYTKNRIYQQGDYNCYVEMISIFYVKIQYSFDPR